MVNFLTEFLKVKKKIIKIIINGFDVINSEKCADVCSIINKMHRNCSCKTFLSNFMVQLFERACSLCMHPHFMIRQ